MPSLLLTSDSTIEWALHKSQELGHLSEDDQCIFFVDLDILDQRLHHLREVFPVGSLHAIPIKTHPLLCTLKHIASQGFGAEAASLEELVIARKAGFPSENMVWDSPAKTKDEIEYCIQNFPGAYVNANSLEELDLFPVGHGLNLGLRILPMMNSGAPEIFDVGAARSKFGEAITRYDEIVRYCGHRPDIVGLHIHAGSDIDGIERNVVVLKKVAELFASINELRKSNSLKPLEYFDIGGGASVRLDDSQAPVLERYSKAIEENCRSLIEGARIITEFGRWTYAHAGWTWSRVAGFRQNEGYHTLILQIGADGFMREVYQSTAQKHAYSLVNPQGKMKSRQDTEKYDLAGPLCFAGDVLQKDVFLPKYQRGDGVIIRNTGANSLSTWSKHCSRRMPKVIVYSQRNKVLQIGKEKETLEDIVSFWS